MSENKRPFPGLSVPEPPEDLRDQVLRRAKQALDKGPRHDLWARIWESRQARLAWAVSVLALAVGHITIPVGDAGPAMEPSTLARTGSDYSEELADISNLPRLSLDALPIIDAFGDPGEGETDEENKS
jgi:hypothetical protein